MTAIDAVHGPAYRGRWRASVLASPAPVLFMCVFTSQAAVLVLSPILVEVARDLIAAGSIASVAAPSFVVLALAQVPVWIGVAVLVAGGVGAAGSASADGRSRVVAMALAGAPAAWIVGMPVIGLVAEASWRLAFVAVPLPAAVVTAALLLTRRPEGPVRRRDASLALLLREPGARPWVLGELLAMSAWAGTLVFSGALFIEVYGVSPRLTGVLLAIVAVAYLVGNTLGGRIHYECLRRALARINVAAAAAVSLIWVVTPNVVVTVVVFSFAAMVVAARTVVGTAQGFALAGERKLEVGAARAALTHAGYLAGSFVGGAALAVGGFRAVGAAFGLLFVAAAAPYLSAWAARCPRRGVWTTFAARQQPGNA